jgi:hypothetical protein
MERYRITITAGGGVEQTWVLLPDLESASTQAEEYARREKGAHVRVYREITGQERELAAEFRPAGP